MTRFNVGDTVVHWTYGIGKITAVADKGLPGSPLFYYEIEAGDLTVWVPVVEAGGASLHRLSTPKEFAAILGALRSPGEIMSNNPYRRHDQLNERMEKASSLDLCGVIRDLTYRAHSRKLSESDTRVLKHAQSSLLDEWTAALGVSREKAQNEIESILKDLQRNKSRRASPVLAAEPQTKTEYLGQYML